MYHSYLALLNDPKTCRLPASSATALPLERIGTTRLPSQLAPDADRRVIEFFTAHIRNPHTRKAYARTAAGFAAWAERCGIAQLRQVEPVHVAAYVEELQARMAAPSRQAPSRRNPDALRLARRRPGPARKPRERGAWAESLRQERQDARPHGRRSLATSRFHRDGHAPRAARPRPDDLHLRPRGGCSRCATEDVFIQGRRTWLRLREKGGKRHEMPCHHKLEAYLQDYAAALP